jgi:trehalose 6-phosphate phosphatase
MTPPVADNPLFFLDYDGTLAPIVDDPMQAYPHESVPDLLRALESEYPLWIVTGRFLNDVEQLLEGSYRAIGLHGIQEGTLGGRKENAISDEAKRAIERLRRTVPMGDGIRVESKGPMFAVHYRLSGDKKGAREAIAEWLKELPDVLTPIWGKDVVELRPSGVSKGTAVRRIADSHPDRTPVYLGDDVTDEDAFEALGQDALTIKVGPGDTAARYRLSDAEAVVQYLNHYIG